jgi:hypothetical protein
MLGVLETSEDEARVACEKSIGQTERYGHGGIIGDLRSVLIEPGD